MSDIKYTSEQYESIKSRGKNIIVSAQAGAGKTEVLVRRIIDLLSEEKINIEDFLIVTFTNKAAAEMEERIKKGIQSKLDECEDDEISYYKKQYNNTSNAQISTMHSFCINTLRDYFYKLGINPKFKILTGSSLDLVKWESINETFNKFYEKEDSRFYNLLDIYSRKYSDEYLKQILFSIYEFIQSQIDPFNWLKENIERYEFKSYYEDKKNYDNKKQEIFLFYKDNFDKLYRSYLNIYKEIENIQDINNKIYLKTLDSDYNLLKSIYDSKTYDKFLESSSSFNFDRLETVSKKTLEKLDISLETKNDINQNIKKYRDYFKDYFNNLELDVDLVIEDEDEIKKVLEIIYDILIEFDNIFKNKKLEKNALDFSDVEHLTIKLLEDEEVVKDLIDKFNYIFFDEYQDANQVQNYIVEKISRKDNLFFVGDIKQSIYKFRLADPLIFKNRYEEYKKGGVYNKAIDIKHNFRSERVILNFNNFIFNNLMTDNLGDINYDDISQRFTPGRKDKDYNDKDSKINLTYIVKDKKDKEDLDVLYESKTINPEAIYVSKKIRELVDKGYKYSDFAILSRSSTIFNDIEQCFKLNNIPYYSDNSIFSYDDIDLKVFISLLKAIENDTDDIILLSAITSTISNLTDNDIAHIRGDDKDHSFNYCFRNYENREDKNLEILDKINIYNRKIKEYRESMRNMSLENFLWYIFVDSGHMSYILSKPEGNIVFDNISLFIDEIKNLENSSFQTLSSIINYIDRMSEKNLSEREAGAELSEKDNVVRIMTIHKSKGLKLENVFLVSLDKRFNLIDLNNTAIFDDNNGISIQISDELNDLRKTFSYEKIAKNKKRELLSEEVRLLYVALSRAVNSIYLVSSGTKTEHIYNENLEDMNSYHKWIYSILSKDKISNSFIDTNKTSDYFKDHAINLNYEELEANKLIEEYDNILNLNQTKIDRISIDENKKDKYKNILNYSYDYSLSNIAYKKTVTEISSKDKNKSSDFKEYEKIVEDNANSKIENNIFDIRPKFEIEDNDKLDYLELGSLYHYILEKLPNRVLEEDEISSFLLYLLENNFISNNEFESIDLNIILLYINTKLFDRIVNSNKVYKENSFIMKYSEDNSENEYLVDGQIDLYFEEDNELVIVDFKTNRVVDENLYKKQLELYKLGLEKSTGKKVKEKIIYWIMNGVETKL